MHLLKILGAGKTGDHCWIATEYSAGESLSAVVGRIPKSGKLDWKAVSDLVGRSYRVVALKRMIAALDGSRRA